MFGMSFGELVIIAILALVLLGPERLPEVAKQGGKLLRQLKSATDDLKDQVEGEMRKATAEIERNVKIPPIQSVPTADKPIPGPSGPPPAATVANVPGLEAALVDVDPEPAVPAAPAPAAAAGDAPRS